MSESDICVSVSVSVICVCIHVCVCLSDRQTGRQTDRQTDTNMYACLTELAFVEDRFFYRALLQKRPIIIRSIRRVPHNHIHTIMTHMHTRIPIYVRLMMIMDSR